MAFRQRKIRQKTSFAEDEEEDQTTVVAKPAAGVGKPAGAKPAPSAAPHAANLPKKDSKPSLLSFAEDFDDTDDAARKSKSKDRKGKVPKAPGVAVDAAHDAASTQRSTAGRDDCLGPASAPMPGVARRARPRSIRALTGRPLEAISA